MIPKKLENYLMDKKVRFWTVDHKKIFTAFDAAKTMKVELKEIAKNLLVKTKDGFAIAIVGADQEVNLEKLAKFLKIAKVDLPKEKVVTEKLKVKPGSLSAFGGVYKVPVYVDTKFSYGREAIFSSGDLFTSIRMRIKDFIALESAHIGAFGAAKKFKQPKNKPTKRPMPKKSKAKSKQAGLRGRGKR